MIELLEPKTKNLEKIFVFWIVLFPITSIYSIPFIPAITLGDLGLFVILPLILISKMTIYRFFAPAISVLIITTSWLFFDLGNGYDALLRTLRFMFSMLIVAFFIPSFFPKGLVLPLIKKIAIISSVFVSIQFLLANFLGIYISGTIPFLVSTPSAEVILDSQGNIIEIRRFFAFFDEPASISTFLSIALLCGLSEDKQKLKCYLPELLMIIGIVISQATTGFGLLIIILGYWFVFSKCKKGVLLFASTSLILLVEIKYGFLTRILNRGIERTSKGWQFGQAAIGRIGNFTAAFCTSGLTPLQLLFGRGMSRLNEFIPGWGRCFIYFGFVGILLFVSIYLYLLFTTTGYARVLAFCLIVLNFFGDYIFGVTPIFILPFIITLSKNQKCFFSIVNPYQLNIGIVDIRP